VSCKSTLKLESLHFAVCDTTYNFTIQAELTLFDLTNSEVVLWGSTIF